MSGECWSLNVVSCGLQTKVWTTLCQLSDEWRVLESECSQLWVTQTKVWTTLCQLSDEWRVLDNVVSCGLHRQKYGQPSVS